MSLFHPETAEDQLAWLPVIGCLLPLALVVVVSVLLLVL
jgi:hypothetical protein